MKRFTINISLALVLGLGILTTLVLLGLLGSGSPVAQAQGPDGESVYYVHPTCSGAPIPCYISVQGAVDAADDPDDVIKIAASTYGGVQARAGVTQVVYINKTVTIQGGYNATFAEPPNPDVNLTTLDAQGEGRVLYITGGANPTIQGLRITNGDASAMDNYGGGVYVVSNSGVTFSDNLVFSNTARYGGGLSLRSSTATLDGNTIFTNTAAFQGGGLFLENVDDSTLNNNTILSNTASSSDGGGIYLRSCDDTTFSGNAIYDNVSVQGRGGGLYSSFNTVTFSGNTIADNAATRGGGLYISNSPITFLSSTVNGNTATSDGGGLYLTNSDATIQASWIMSNTASSSGGGFYLYESDLMIKGNEIISNTASIYGGGLYVSQNSAPTLINNIVADNLVGPLGRGGGLYVIRSSPTLLHTTLARNVGGDGSGVYVTTQSSVALTNTILVSHSVGIQVQSGNMATLEATLWANDVDWSGPGDIVTSDDYWDDPAFLNPQAKDYRLASSSAARDAGVDAGVTDDIDGDLRPSDWGFDIGADERGSALAIRKTAWPPYLHNGEMVTYTLTITSAGSETATNVRLTDTLPPPQIIQDITSDPPLACTPGAGWGGSSTCDLGALASRATVRITLTARMTTAVPDEKTWQMRNTAWVKATETPSRTARISTIRVYCRARRGSDPFIYDTVQAAVDDSVPGDEVWVSGYCAYVALRGEITQTVYLSKALTVQGGWNLAFDTRNATSYPTTLDAQGQGRVLCISGDITSTVEDLRIVNGDATGLAGGFAGRDAGGGVYVIDATATLSNVQVLSNVAEYGGGLYLEESDAVLNSLTVNGNTATGNGGGLYMYLSEATLSESTINNNNSAALGAGLYLLVSDVTLGASSVNNNYAQNNGGGLYINKGDVVLHDNDINNNVTDKSGGGLYVSNGNGTFSRNTINGNNAQQLGGGLYLYFGNVALDNSTVNDNVASNGGGLYIFNCSATLDKNTIDGNQAQNGGGLYLWRVSDRALLNANWITDNSASVLGGGLFMKASETPLANNVFAGNQAETSGDGLHIEDSFPRLLHTTIARNNETGINIRFNSEVELVNTILVSHSVGIQIASGSTAILEATLWGDSLWANGDDWAGAGTVNHTLDYPEDPVFEDYAAGDYHIVKDSAPIDAGVNAGVLTDIDGEPRPAGLAYELGADERGLSLLLHKDVWPHYLSGGDVLTYTLIVTATGSETAPATNVQLTDTLALPQKVIDVTPAQGSCSHSTDWGGGVSCNLGTLEVDSSTRITLTAQMTRAFFDPPVWQMRNAAWVTSTETVSRAAYAETTRVYCRVRRNEYLTTYDSVQEAVDVSLTGDVVKIAGYCAPTDPSSQVVYLDKSLTLQGGWHLSFTQRSAVNYPTTLDARGDRRVFYITGDIHPTVQGLRIIGGDATGLGGGLAGEDAGGGLYITTAPANIQDNQIIGNSAEVGGGLYLSGSDATLTNNIIAGNQADDDGSGLYIAAASPRFLHTTIANNDGSESGVYVTDNGLTYSFPAMTNTILANHSLGITVTDGSAVSLESTLRYDNDQDWGGTVNANQNYDGDPDFTKPAARDYHVGLASAALDKCLDVGLTTDLDGQPRPLGDGCEIGADESGMLVAQWDDPDPVWSGAQLTYVISITNMSPDLLTAAITDVLPAQVSTTQAHEWSPVGIAPGAAWAQTLVVTVEKDYAGTLTNVVQVTTDQGPEDTSIETTLSLAALLAVTKQADPAVVYGGDPLAYTLRVTNTGNVDLVATITDTLPPYVTTAQPLLWSPVNLAPDDVWEQTLVVTPDFNYAGPLANVVQVTTEQGATGAYTETSTALLPPPGIPTLLAPPNGRITTTQDITFSWQQGVGSDPIGYNLELDGGVITPTGMIWPTNLDLGVHTWRVRAYNTSGYSDWSAPWTVEVTSILPPPSVPTLLSPPDGTITSAPVVTFTWEEGAGSPASGYRLKLDGDDTDVSGTSWSTNSLSLGVHTWTVQAYNDQGDSDWALPWTVEITVAPGIPILLSPSDGLITTTQDILLSWQQGAGPDPNGYNLDLDGAVVTTTGTTWPASLALGVHTWRVRAYESVNTSAWSDPWTVEITDTLPPPNVPILLSPSNGAITNTRGIVLAWQASPGAAPSGYSLDLNGAIITPSGTTWPANLLPGVHTWQVRAYNSAGSSGWTAPWTVEVVNNAPYAPSNPDPPHNAGAVPITPTLGWGGGDPDGDLVTYTVALGISDPPPVVSSSVVAPIYHPGVLDPETTYYWRITADDGYDTSSGPLWQFTTAEPGDYTVYLPLVVKSGP